MQKELILIKKFWNWARNEDDDSRTLYLNGIIAGNDTWFDDDVTPAVFKAELEGDSSNDPVTVWIDSTGGDLFAAAEIYNALKEYKGKVTVKIGSIAASAASVIAMSGDEIFISPVGQILIHNPSTLSVGDSNEMRRAAEMLDSVKSSIINAYQRRTGMSRAALSQMMDNSHFMDADEAIEKGFCDGVLFSEATIARDNLASIFNCPADISKITRTLPQSADVDPDESKQSPETVTVESLYKRLNLLSH